MSNQLSAPRTSLSPIAAVAALALAVVVTAFGAASPPRKVIPSSSEASRNRQADGGSTARAQSGLPILSALDPAVASLEVRSIKDGAPVLPADAVDRVLSVAGDRPLLLIEVRGLPLSFARLPSRSNEMLRRQTYEEGFSKRLAQLVREVRAKRPGTAIGVVGLPIERGDHVEDTNRSYDEALQAVTVMNPLGGLVTSGMDTGSLARSQYRESFKAAKGRPVVFRGGNGWQVVVPPPDNSSPPPTTIVPPSSTPNESGAGDVQDPVPPPVLGPPLVPEVVVEPPAQTGQPAGGSPNEPPALVVGSGFSGPTAAPPAAGQPGNPGYGATPAARWTQVPMTTFKQPLNVGVAAFHRNGIDRVEFSANGGPWVPVTTMATNPQTGVCEYFCKLNPQGAADGSIEVRAIVYPKGAGTPRLLAGPFRATSSSFPAPNGVYSFWCWANAGGTYDRTPVYVSSTGSDTTGNGTQGNPYKTLAKASGALNTLYSGNQSHCEIVISTAGTYAYTLSNGVGGGSLPNATSDGWITVRAADDIDRDDVILTTTASNQPLQRLLKVKGCTAQCLNGYFINQAPMNDGRLVWFDDVLTLQPGGRYDPSNNGYTFANNVVRVFLTDSDWYDVHGGPAQVILARNVKVTKIAEDGIRINQSHGSAFNVVIDDVNAGSTGAHPDLVSSYDPSSSADNIIVYGLKATNYFAQWHHLVFTQISNSAFVNCLTTDANGSTGMSQCSAPMQHVLFLHNTIYQQSYRFMSTVDSNCAFVGNAYQQVSISPPATSENLATAHWEHNNFVAGAPFGTDATTAAWASIVVNPAYGSSGDFAPLGGSPLRARVPWGFNWTDVYGSSRPALAATGAVEGQ